MVWRSMHRCKTGGESESKSGGRARAGEGEMVATTTTTLMQGENASLLRPKAYDRAFFPSYRRTNRLHDEGRRRATHSI